MSDEVFVEQGIVVKLKNGENVVLPKLTIGKIMMITDSMNELIKEAGMQAPELIKIFTEDSEAAGINLVKSLPTLLPVLLGQVVKVLSKYLGIEEEFIKDNMDLEDLVNVTTPFLANILAQGNHLVGPLNQAMAKLKPTPTGKSPSAKPSAK